VAQCVYVVLFLKELWHLIARRFRLPPNSRSCWSCSVLIDVVMISNLLVMVIVGGYETFVSRLNLNGHPDEPEWLSHVNASVLKIKLAMAIIGISSIHLLRTFIEAGALEARRAHDKLHRDRCDVADHHPHRCSFFRPSASPMSISNGVVEPRHGRTRGKQGAWTGRCAIEIASRALTTLIRIQKYRHSCALDLSGSASVARCT
jgi:uncharacterized membrane protein YqhA